MIKTKEELRVIGKNNSMRFRVRSNDFVGSNVSFDLDTLKAHSYNWWRFVDIIDGKVVFNGYFYSSSTSKHQGKVRGLLSDLGVKVDVCIKARKGLQNLEVAISDYEDKIKELIQAIQRPRTRKSTNERRVAEIEYIQGRIAIIKELMNQKAVS